MAKYRIEMEGVKILYNVLFIITIPKVQRTDDVVTVLEYAVVVRRIRSGERGNFGVLHTMLSRFLMP